MHFAFIDDVEQPRPTRPEMGPIVGMGALLVDSKVLRDLEQGLYQLCLDTGFPVSDHKKSEFKWSPGRELWMTQDLTGTTREDFLLTVTHLLQQQHASLIVVLEDELYNVADAASPNHKVDAVRLLFERINRFLEDKDENAVVISDRAAGDIPRENDFLAASIEMLREGTRFVTFDRIALNIVCTQSRFVRLLQAVDVAIGCVAAYVSGEEKYSPVIFGSLLPLFVSGAWGIGGIGLKLHPEYRHGNLYHWLLGEPYLAGPNMLLSLPLRERPHSTKPPHIAACELWRKVTDEVKTRRPLIQSWVELALPHRVRDDSLTLLFHHQEQLAAESLFRPNNRKFVESILLDICGREITIRCDMLRRPA
jgi:hypothetical protein